MMIVYGSSISPFVRKVLVIAEEKGLEVDNQPGGRMAGDEFKETSPFGKIPGFRDGDYVLADSSAIAHYMDAVHPARPMIPAEAKARGTTIWYEEFADTILMAAGGKIFFNRFVAPKFMGQPGDEALIAQGEAELPPLCAYLEGVIPASNYLVGDQLTLADIAVTCAFVNLDYVGTVPDAAQFPKLTAYLKAMCARPSFAKWIAADKAFMAKMG